MTSPSVSILLHGIPTLILVLAGSTYAVLKWRRHPRVSFIVLVALGLLVASNAGWYLFWAVAQATHRTAFITLATYASSFLSAMEQALLVFAAFYGYYEARQRGAEPASTGTVPN